MQEQRNFVSPDTYIKKNKGGVCIPNSTTEVWTVIDVDLLLGVRLQLDQHVLSSNTLRIKETQAYLSTMWLVLSLHVLLS